MNLDIVPCATRKQCVSKSANQKLLNFDAIAKTWGESDRTNSSNDIINGLLVLANPDSDCWRFFYKTFNKLMWVTPDLPVKHTHYWDTLGKVAGRVVCAEWPDEDIAFSEKIFKKPWIDKFTDREWVIRSTIMRAFRDVARNCAQWDEHFEAVLSHYYVYCFSTSSILRKQIPKYLDDAIVWLFEIWELIAKKCQEERFELFQKELKRGELKRKKEEIEKTICKIIGIAVPLLKILERISDLGSINADDCFRHWKRMLYDYTFSKENLRGRQKNLIKTKKVKFELENHRAKSGRFVDEVKYIYRKKNFEEYVLYKCDMIVKDF